MTGRTKTKENKCIVSFLLSEHAEGIGDWRYRRQCFFIFYFAPDLQLFYSHEFSVHHINPV